MERSSPLAAMQAPSLPFGNWGCRADLPSSNSHYGGSLAFGPSSFNFRELSMSKAPQDYFSLKPVRGSSPTASLAADLSQNFHIDKSPQLPTPRRSLFSSNLFGTLNGRESVITPPLPSSSPGPGNDSMDISPLPHKAPYLAVTRIEVQSPTPEPTPTAESILSSPNDVPESPYEAMKPPALAERKRPTWLRPSLSRTKGFSTNTVSLKSAGLESQLPPFKFGNGPLTASATMMSLEECFVESPQQDSKLTYPNPSALSTSYSRSRLSFQATNSHTRNSGSPLVCHVRKPSAPVQRPRKQFRRSLSMFEHPADIMKSEKTEGCIERDLQTIMDVDDLHQLKLPHFLPETESIPRITKETMIDILDGKYSHCYDQSLVIDCRFEYEYKGGHIEGAVNFNNKEELASKLFECSSPQTTLLILHCEYSAHRAPIAAGFVRHQDRAQNVHQYPKLNYPEVYILHGGYSSFYTDHRTRCFPQSYVEMSDKAHANACERGLGRIKQQRAKLSRAQTFAFGQQSQPTEDSPTALSRHCSDFVMSMDISNDRLLDLKRVNARRMASY